MSLVTTQSPEEATGKIAEVYGQFLKGSGVIPGPVQLLSASPGLFETYTNTFRYWVTHPRFSRDLMGCIRHGIAVQQGFPACVTFNEAVLGAMGMSDEELAELRRAPDTAPLEENERALLDFVLRAVRDPAAIAQADVDSLKALGWTDADVVDATYHGAILVTMGILMKAFKA